MGVLIMILPLLAWPPYLGHCAPVGSSVCSGHSGRHPAGVFAGPDPRGTLALLQLWEEAPRKRWHGVPSRFPDFLKALLVFVSASSWRSEHHRPT